MQFLKKSIFLWFLFFVITQVLYWPARNAGLVTDFVGTVDRLHDANLMDVILNTFGFYGFQQINYLFLFLFYNLFGVSEPLGWHLIYTTTHATNAYLIFFLFCYLFQKGSLKYGTVLAIGIAALWLTSPYHSEAVVWEVCYSYLITTAMMFGTLFYAVRWMEDRVLKHLIYSHLLFLIALFTFENSFVIPGLTILMILFFYGSQRLAVSDQLSAANRQPPVVSGQSLVILLYLFGVQVVLLFIRLLMSKIVFGSWVAHYGDDIHFNLNLKDWLASHYKYASQYLFYTRYLSDQYEGAFMQFFTIPRNIYWISGILFSLLIFLLIYFQRASFKTKFLAFFALSFVAALFPVHNLYIVTLLYVEGGRLGYLASIFFYGFLVILISYLPRLVWIILIVFGLAFNSYFLRLTNSYWKGSAYVSNSLLDKFKWVNEEEIILLNVPDNFQGAPMFRNITGNQLAFGDAIKHLRQKPIQGKLYEVVQYNMTKVTDGVKVELDSTDRLKVTFNQYGNWWWRLSIGATDYENERFRFINQGQHYLLEFKQPIENCTILYQDGAEWKEFHTSN